MKSSRSRRRRNGFLIAALGFLLAYGSLALITAVLHSTAPKQAERDASAGGPGSAPGFLDTAPLPSSGEDVFVLYDRSSEQKLEVDGKTLLTAAVACEMDLSAPDEALKAQAVACYTLFCRQRGAGEAIACDSSRWQVWTTWEQMKERWGEDTEAYLARLSGIVEQVYGQVLKWGDEPILAAYSAISSGSTETAGNVWSQDLPYLQAVASPGDCFSDGYLSTAVFSAEELKKAASGAFPALGLDFSGPEKEWLTGLQYTSSGYVSSGRLGGKELTGTQLRTAFSLRSASFSVEYREGSFTFTVHGWGHGVGMSQAGAVFLAKRGKTCREILSYYYPGTELGPL